MQDNVYLFTAAGEDPEFTDTLISPLVIPLSVAPQLPHLLYPWWVKWMQRRLLLRVRSWQGNLGGTPTRGRREEGSFSNVPLATRLSTLSMDRVTPSGR